MKSHGIVWIITALAVMAIFAFPLSGHADKDGDDPFGRWWQRPGVAGKMNLDAELVDRLDALYLERKSRLIDLKAELEKEKLKLKTMLDSANPTREEAMAQFQTVNDLRNQLGRERFVYFLDVRDMIGHERFKVLSDWYKQRREALRQAFKDKKRELDAADGAPDEQEEESAAQ